MPRRPNPVASAISQMWFPAALIMLLLVAIPGLILFVLNLFGKETAVNAWLVGKWSLTYHIPIPWWAGLILVLIPLMLLVLYFLKLKRRPLHVPSTFLWKKSIEDLHVNSLFQWLRQNVLLLLQLLTVLVLLYSLMSFQLHGHSVEGKNYIIMIDNSASMSATDVEKNRLEQAKKEAIGEIDAHSDNDTGMVIVFNSSASILGSFTHDRSVLRHAVEGIEPTQRPTRIEEALTLADSLANPRRSTDDAASRPPGEDPSKARTYVAAEGTPTEVHLFSDGRFPDVPEFTLGNLNVKYHAIGDQAPDGPGTDNVGITMLNATRDDTNPSRLLVFVTVENYRRTTAEVNIELEVYHDGNLRDVADVKGREVSKDDDKMLRIARRQLEPVDPGNPDGAKRDRPGQESAVFVVPDVADKANVVLRAVLRGHKDRFPLDDDAWLVVGVIRKARILMVGPENRPLSAFFDHPATQKMATVTYLDPDALKDDAKYKRPAHDGAWDLVIFDRCHPEEEDDMPSANTWFIGSVPPGWGKGEKTQGPPVKGWAEKHPLLRYLTGLHEIGIDGAFRLDMSDPKIPPRTPRLLESDKNTVLMFTIPRQSFTDLIQTFPIIDEGKYNTNWPVLSSFPLFVRNVTYVLGNVSDTAAEPSVKPGEVMTLRPDVAVREIEVVNPAKESKKEERGTRPDFTYGKTDRVGIYQVRWDGKEQRHFAVNLLDADESNIEPRSEIKIGDASIKTNASSGQPRDTWKWVALAALILLLVEWYVYNRRVYI
jgi:hypothetical protein